MKARIAAWWREINLQLRIRNKEGRREFNIYRLERNYPLSLIWAPSKGRWVRARVYYWGFKNARVLFVDGAEKTGERSPLSIRPRDPRRRGIDKPRQYAGYSGNRGPSMPERYLVDLGRAAERTAITINQLREAFIAAGGLYERES